MNHPILDVVEEHSGEAVTRDSNIGRILLEMGKLKASDAERVLRTQKERGMRFGEAAKYLGLITAADIQQALARQFDYPYLQKNEGKYPKELLAAYQPFSTQVEALRAVRSQLMLRWFAQGHKALAVVGLDDGDGVSLFAANLAVVFSQLGEHTLLVDANMRTPRQHTIFDLGASQGLSDILVGRADTGAVSKINHFVDLSILGAGTPPPNPQELISREAFTALNTKLEQSFDVVLYDVAAFSSGADALTIGARVGGVLIVTRKDKTRLDDISDAIEQFTRNGTDVVGTVMVNF